MSSRAARAALRRREWLTLVPRTITPRLHDYARAPAGVSGLEDNWADPRREDPDFAPWERDMTAPFAKGATDLRRNMHVAIEQKRWTYSPDPWWLQIPSFFVARDYVLYGLAGWRVEGVVGIPAPIAPSRGLPRDASPELRRLFAENGGSDATWLTRAEWATVVDRAAAHRPAGRARRPLTSAEPALADALALRALIDSYATSGSITRVVVWFN
jgi:hypothetical protein